jgi:phosphogluconate dehydratase
MVLRVIEKITDDIIEQSKRTRYEYLERIERDFADMQKGSPLGKQVQRDRVMSPAARAHATWQWPDEERKLINMPAVNIGVISSHNGVLSSLENFERDPYIIEATAKQLAAERGFRIKSQIVGRMPNMCDGNTQGRRGMALSVYSRETGAEAFDEGDGHDITNRTVVLTACDKSVPASLEGAGDSGHKPTIWIPAGTMNDGIPDIEKQKVREAFARGELGYDEWQVSENEAYKGGGICQFLGTAATGEFVKLALGLGLPGTGYIFASSREVHDAIVWESVKQLVDLDMPVGRMIDERSIVNATVTCLAIGGSTNYAIHMIAIAKSFGIVLTPENIAELSDNVVQILSVYPNQKKFNINAIPLSGGEGYAFRTLIDNGYIDPETNTVRGRFGDHYTQQAVFTKRKTPKNQFPTIDNVPININCKTPNLT